MVASGRTSTRDLYFEPHPFSLHTHPLHQDPEYDERMAAAARVDLWVVTAVSNPVRYKTRYGLYKRFRHHVTEELGLNLVTVECAHADRDFQLTEDGHGDAVMQAVLPHGAKTIDVRVRNRSQVWLKENLWNIGARHLPRECKYVLFCDADIQFLNPHIATEIVHALQEHRVVQPFETVVDMGPDGQVIDVHRSFGWCHARGWEWRPRADGDGGYGCKRPSGIGRYEGYGTPWHPGFALAMRRSVLDRLPLLEVGVLGAGDHHMMGALIGKADLTLPRHVHARYRDEVMAWQRRAEDVVRRDLGYVPGTILHSFHGAKANRRYVQRWDILVRHKYDPTTDVYRNSQGVLELEEHNPALRDAIRLYFRQRNEDGMDL